MKLPDFLSLIVPSLSTTQHPKGAGEIVPILVGYMEFCIAVILLYPGVFKIRCQAEPSVTPFNNKLLLKYSNAVPGLLAPDVLVTSLDRRAHYEACFVGDLWRAVV